MEWLSQDSGEIKILNTDINKDLKTKESIAYVGDEFSGYLKKALYLDLHKIISVFYTNWDEKLYKKYMKQFNLNED